MGRIINVPADKDRYVIFDSIPVNFSDLNTEYDDYNSAYPPGSWGFDRTVVFSTNRESEGGDFDFISYNIRILYSTTEHDVEEIDGHEYDSPESMHSFSYLNSEFDELGPFYWEAIYSADNSYRLYSFLYSDNSPGNHDIKGLVYYWNNNGANIAGQDSVASISGLHGLNTEFNELYPSIRDDEIYFTSDRAGKFDIYLGKIQSESVFTDSKIELSSEISLMEELSGPADDKCPFVFGDIMVFTSDRDAGFGGFDLYYSVHTENGWSAPINFGEEINTEYDEYRPIIIAGEDLGNDLMIFSSNRTGGKGGFDLYYVGIPKDL